MDISFVIVAMDKEFALMRNSLTNITTDEKDLCIGNTDAGKVVLVKSGIGKVNSAITACTMIKEITDMGDVYRENEKLCLFLEKNAEEIRRG